MNGDRPAVNQETVARERSNPAGSLGMKIQTTSSFPNTSLYTPDERHVHKLPAVMKWLG